MFNTPNKASSIFSLSPTPAKTPPVVSPFGTASSYTSSPSPGRAIAHSVRSDVVMIYDRWVRTDTGGFIKSIKSAIGALEDMDLVREFPEITGIGKLTSLCYNDSIRGSALSTFRTKFDSHLEEAKKALVSLEKTIDHIATVQCRYSTLPPVIHDYLDLMRVAMLQLMGLRRNVLAKISAVESFTAEFERIQFHLLMLAETSEDYIPRYVGVRLSPSSGLLPLTLEDVLDDGGRSLFPQLDDISSLS